MPISKRSRQLFATLVAVSSGCGGVEPQDLPRGGFWEVTVGLPAIDPVVVLLVVDDAPAAAPLREQLLEPLRTSLHRLTPNTQPGAWRPVDWSVVVVLPSAGIIGPSDAPSLQLRDADLDEAEADALVEEIGAIMAAHQATDAAPLTLIEAAHSAVSLVTEQRPAMDAHEAAVQESLRLREVPGQTHRSGMLQVVVASTRDDASPEPVESYPLRDASDAWHVFAKAVIPTDACNGLSTPRLEAWIAANASPFAVEPWPCSATRLEEQGLLSLGWSSTSGHGRWSCTSQPIATQSDRSAACRILAEWSAPERSCASAGRGWVDPLDRDGVRRPRLGQDWRGESRLCEIPQLEGAALASCQSDVECPECGHGWCRSEIELGAWCPEGELETKLRFTGNAIAGTPARLHIQCALEG